MTKSNPLIHRAKRHLMGWEYRGVVIKQGTMRPGFMGHYLTHGKFEGEVRESATLSGMKSLIDRLLDGPATT